MVKKKIKGTLDENQVKFITNKVKELGSIDAVKKYYDVPCFVTDYANQLANLFYGRKKPKRIKLKSKEVINGKSTSR